jgi:hypothetical protein
LSLYQHLDTSQLRAVQSRIIFASKLPTQRCSTVVASGYGLDRRSHKSFSYGPPDDHSPGSFLTELVEPSTTASALNRRPGCSESARGWPQSNVGARCVHNGISKVHRLARTFGLKGMCRGRFAAGVPKSREVFRRLGVAGKDRLFNGLDVPKPILSGTIRYEDPNCVIRPREHKGNRSSAASSPRWT